MKEEKCYVCTLPMERSSEIYVVEDDEGVKFLIHKACAEEKMEIVERRFQLDGER